MAYNIRIFNGNRIGGCSTVISTDKSKIAIDFGLSLPGGKDTTDISIDWDKEKVDGVFFTHYHGDHIGRFKEIPENVDLYMGKITYDVLYNIGKRVDGEACTILDKRLRGGTIKFVEKGRPIRINDDMVVTGYAIDHSAFDAFMYLVEADGKHILHTGDFRDHGHRGHKKGKNGDRNVLLEVIKYYVLQNGARQIDDLIIEGTMLGERFGEKQFSEKELQAQATRFFKEHRHVFIKISSTNVDSLASFYHGARANNLTMYASPYLLDQFKVYAEAGRSHGTSFYDFFGVRRLPFVVEGEGADNAPAARIIGEMRGKGFVAIVSEQDQWLMDELADCKPKLIYSMWKGFLDPKHPAYNGNLAAFCQKYDAIIMHTSGHAYPETIEAVINAVKPARIWPIHTENAPGFKLLNISEKLKAKL